MRRIKCVVQYDGTDFAGFQIQPGAPTIQGALEHSLRSVIGKFERFGAASRTDAGVHALGQVIAFDTTNPIPVNNLVRAMNEHLPKAINMLDAEEVPRDFRPRQSAVGKVYTYRIYNTEAGPPYITRFAWHIRSPYLNLSAMRQAGEYLKGRHDFAAFRSAGSVVQNTIRTIKRLEMQRQLDTLEVQVEGDGFLYHMVRNIMGYLVEVGMGRHRPEEIQDILASRDRTRLGPPAPPQGLWLTRVLYDTAVEGES